MVADPPEARRFAAQVQALIGQRLPDAVRAVELLKTFREWQAMKPAVDPLAERAPIFQDAQGVASDLAELATMGEQAVGYLANRTSPPPEWGEKQNSVLEQASQPNGLPGIAVLDAMRELVTAAESAGSVSQP